MANWLIDTTDLIAIKHDLLHEARVGDAVLGFLGLGDQNQYVSLIPGGVKTGWLPYTKDNANTGQLIRRFDILLIDGVTVQICKQVAAFQMGSRIYKKQSETPYDGVSTPAKWIYNVMYVGAEGGIAL